MRSAMRLPNCTTVVIPDFSISTRENVAAMAPSAGVVSVTARYS
jgi:hypothetical protein